MTKVRKCTLEDLDFLMEKAIAFNHSYYDIPLNLEKTEQYIKTAIEIGVVLRSDFGAIVGVVIDDPFRDWKVLVEIAWYSEGIDGARLLKQFHYEAWMLKVNEIRMTTLEVNPGVAKYLKSIGYSPMETSHRLLL